MNTYEVELVALGHVAARWMSTNDETLVEVMRRQHTRVIHARNAMTDSLTSEQHRDDLNDLYKATDAAHKAWQTRLAYLGAAVCQFGPGNDLGLIAVYAAECEALRAVYDTAYQTATAFANQANHETEGANL